MSTKGRYSSNTNSRNLNEGNYSGKVGGGWGKLGLARVMCRQTQGYFAVATRSRCSGFVGFPPRIRAKRTNALERRSLVLELLGLLVESNALGASVDRDESSDSELLAGLLHRPHPRSLLVHVLGELLALSQHLLGHDLSVLVEAKVFLGQTSLGVSRGTVPDLAVRTGHHLTRHSLGLSGADGLFGCLRLGSTRLGGGLGGLWLSGLARGTAGGAFRGFGLLRLGGGADCGADCCFDGHFGLVSEVALEKFFQN